MRAFFCFLVCVACSTPPVAPVQKSTPQASSAPDELGYQTGPASPDGTGRFYLGREIAQVMGYQGAEWLERPSRQEEELPDQVIQALSLKPTDIVADLGAGTGYFTFRISAKVPQGKVIAIDVQPEMLKLLEENKKAKNISNVELLLGTESDSKLPKASVDLVLLVDVYHELYYPKEVMQSVVQALRPGGRVVLVEYRGEDPNVPIKPLHKTTQAQIKKELEVVGLQWKETKDFLPQQNLMIFEAKPN